MKNDFLLKNGIGTAAIAFAALLLFACTPDTATINYELPASISTEVFSQNYYSTMDNNDVEQIGTITETRYFLTYSQIGDTLQSERKFIADASKGYLKKSHPAELALRLPQLKITAKDLQVHRIEGNENFDSVVSKLDIPDRWKKQISRLTSQTDLDRSDKLHWEITHLLSGEIPLNSDITELLRSRRRLPLAGVEIDSVKTADLHKIDGRKCLEYTVYLREKDPYPYFIWEQHISTVSSGKPFKDYHPQNAFYQNRYEVAINTQDGTPCVEREYKYGIHGMKNPETGDSVTFKSLVSKVKLYNR